MYNELPGFASMSGGEERGLYLERCAEELGVLPEDLSAYLVKNDVERDHPLVYAECLVNALRVACDELPRIKNRKLNSKGEMDRIVDRAAGTTLGRLDLAA